MRKKITTTDFIEKAEKIHGDKYDYSKVEYINSQTKVCIICPEHGEFWQTPNSHLKGCGCFKCGTENSAKGHLSNTSKFIEKAKLIFGDSYDYSMVNYEKSSKKIFLKCNKCHKVFSITPNNHLKGQGCPICAKEKKGPSKKSLEDFITLAREIHGYKYDYSKSEYISSQDKLLIICPEHGKFWQTPSNHLRGQGCPFCKESKLEKDTKRLLENNKVVFEQNKHFDWLGKQHLDFYLPEYNIAIECQGVQHVYPVCFGGNRFKSLNEQLSYVKKMDENKYKTCKLHGINIFYLISNEICKNDLYKNEIYSLENSFYDCNILLKKL